MDLSNFQELLLRVGQALGREQIRALAFLCADLLNPDPSTISMESATDLFRGLMDRDLLTEDRPYLLADLLSVVGCFRLLRQFGLYQMISTTKSLICPYR
ncbi:hypothetical protein NHX12_007706 [Muraenolepis orangiensis]|uniref:DED domain-containing protein n=1 Tax=Muraenolepis orangiensis TaxID=630683 RepID=A0A9Q0DND3_9TELE|nr:hypothetical protein NHX12_007706 [Muraenolepis orangiensis]